MFCNQCGTALLDTARYCHQCGFATRNARSNAKGNERAAASQSMSRKVPARVLSVAGITALVWAALVLVALAVGTREGWPQWMGAFGNAALLSACALTLFRRDPRALPVSWTIVVLSGLSTVNNGLVPHELIMWTGWLVFTLYLGTRRNLFFADAGAQDRPVRQPKSPSQSQPKAQAAEPLLAFPSEGHK